jgi:hypothetical protein
MISEENISHFLADGYGSKPDNSKPRDQQYQQRSE